MVTIVANCSHASSLLSTVLSYFYTASHASSRLVLMHCVGEAARCWSLDYLSSKQADIVQLVLTGLRDRTGEVREASRIVFCILYCRVLPSHADLASLDTLDDLVNMVAREINDEISKLVARVKDMEIRVTTAFDKFRDQFPAESADLGAGLEFAGDYFRLLETLERDRLPDFEAKFRELLRQQSMQNLSQLRQYLTEERRDILQRLELVNESLHVVPFNVTNGRRTFLRITTQERMLPEVVEFRKRIRDALEGAWDVKVEDGEAEKRFAILAELVSSLKDLPENRRYRDTVLDVRRHVDFIGEEVDDDGRQIEVYRSGAGKSGGQRQKLTTTCLAAALRYQLCGDSVSVPTYALVVLDEAFDKADSDFTTLAMNIFRQFGFQMIVATPDKAVTTLEPFIGGACVVHIVERKYSSVLTIPYDGAVHRLVWKAPPESAEPVKEA